MENVIYFLINTDSKCYLMNRKNVVKGTGIKLPGFENTLIDGEYITVDKKGKSISLFMVFDIYFFKGSDVRKRVLNRSTDDRADANSTIKKSRFEYLEDFFDEYSLERTTDTNIKFRIELKKFLETPTLSMLILNVKLLAYQACSQKLQTQTKIK